MSLYAIPHYFSLGLDWVSGSSCGFSRVISLGTWMNLGSAGYEKEKKDFSFFLFYDLPHWWETACPSGTPRLNLFASVNLTEPSSGRQFDATDLSQQNTLPFPPFQSAILLLLVRRNVLNKHYSSKEICSRIETRRISVIAQFDSVDFNLSSKTANFVVV